MSSKIRGAHLGKMWSWVFKSKESVISVSFSKLKKMWSWFLLSELKKIPAWQTWTYRLLPRAAPNSFPGSERSNLNKEFLRNVSLSMKSISFDKVLQVIKIYEEIRNNIKFVKMLINDIDIFTLMYLINFVWFEQILKDTCTSSCFGSAGQSCRELFVSFFLSKFSSIFKFGHIEQ